MSGGVSEWEGEETRGKGAGKLKSFTEKETGGDMKYISSPCFLCALCASVVKVSTLGFSGLIGK